jgi:hypothetical protein
MGENEQNGGASVINTNSLLSPSKYLYLSLKINSDPFITI